MAKALFEDKTFDKINFTEQPLEKGDYESCEFINCQFAGVDLSQVNFASCTFRGCNMSMAKMTKTAMRDIRFISCKLMGMPFDSCNEFLFSVGFDECMLNLSSFYKVNLKKTKFKNCSLHETDFTQADLNATVFDNCDFAGATFDRTILENADLRSSYNYS